MSTIPAAPPAPAPAPTGTAPDPALLARIQAETGVETELRPALTDYARQLRDRALEALDTLLGQADLGESAQLVGLWVVGGLVPAVLLFLLGRALWRRRRHAAPETADGASTGPSAPLRGAQPDRVAAALARGDARGALGAAWEAMAAALAGRGLGPQGPEQTEREFEAGVRRRSPDWSGLPELRALRRATVIGLYGPDDPSLDEVEALVARTRDLSRAAAAGGDRG